MYSFFGSVSNACFVQVSFGSLFSSLHAKNFPNENCNLGMLEHRFVSLVNLYWLVQVLHVWSRKLGSILIIRCQNPLSL